MAEKTDCNNHKWIPLLGTDKGKSVPTSLFTCLKCGDLRVGATTIKISQYRLDMDEKPIYNIAGIRLNETPTNNQTASGLIVSMTYGVESITVGDLLYFKSDGKVYKANATDATAIPAPFPVMGLALATTAAGGPNNVLLHGIYKDSTKWTGGTALAIGGVCYLSTVAGATIQAQPSALDNVIQVVGVATAANIIYFNPSPDYITHAA